MFVAETLLPNYDLDHRISRDRCMIGQNRQRQPYF